MLKSVSFHLFSGWVQDQDTDLEFMQLHNGKICNSKNSFLYIWNSWGSNKDKHPLNFEKRKHESRKGYFVNID